MGSEAEEVKQLMHDCHLSRKVRHV